MFIRGGYGLRRGYVVIVCFEFIFRISLVSFYSYFARFLDVEVFR